MPMVAIIIHYGRAAVREWPSDDHCVGAARAGIIDVSLYNMTRRALPKSNIIPFCNPSHEDAFVDHDLHYLPRIGHCYCTLRYIALPTRLDTVCPCCADCDPERPHVRDAAG